MRPRLRLRGFGRSRPASHAGPTTDELLARQRRIAAELHGTLAQELALIVTYASTLSARGDGGPAIEEVREAAQRALDESRRVIQLLEAPMAGSAESPRERRNSDVAVAAVGGLQSGQATGSLRR